MVPALGPCLSSWGEEEITEREKRERELGGYGFGEVSYIINGWHYNIYAWICHTFPVQVLCRESCLGIEPAICRGQQDCSPAGRMGTSSEPALGCEGNHVSPSFPILHMTIGYYLGP